MRPCEDKKTIMEEALRQVEEVLRQFPEFAEEALISLRDVHILVLLVGAAIAVFLVIKLFQIVWACLSWLAGVLIPGVRARRRHQMELERQEAEAFAIRQYQERVERQRLEELARQEEVRDKWAKVVANVQGIADSLAVGHGHKPPGEYFLRLVTWQCLEHVVASLMRIDGWTTYLTNRGNDGGVDIIGERSGPEGLTERIYCQVKQKTNKGSSVGAPVLQQLMGAASADNVDHILIATTGRFSQAALNFRSTARNDIEVQLWDDRDLAVRVDALEDEEFFEMTRPYIDSLVAAAQKEANRVRRSAQATTGWQFNRTVSESPNTDALGQLGQVPHAIQRRVMPTQMSLGPVSPIDKAHTSDSQTKRPVRGKSETYGLESASHDSPDAKSEPRKLSREIDQQETTWSKPRCEICDAQMLRLTNVGGRSYWQCPIHITVVRFSRQGQS